MQRTLTIVFGIIFIGVGIFIHIQNNALIKNCTVESEAIVVDMKEELSTDEDNYNTYMYYPIIEYKAGNKTIRENMKTGSSKPEYNINDKVTILYNPNKTNEFIVKGEKTSSIFSIIFIVFGVLIASYAISPAFKNNN